jgi:hypothetical protein
MPSRNLRELAEYHARESVRAAYLTDLSEYRETWLKVAQEWLDEARLRGSKISPTVADLVVPTGNPIRLPSRRRIG